MLPGRLGCCHDEHGYGEPTLRCVNKAGPCQIILAIRSQVPLHVKGRLGKVVRHSPLLGERQQVCRTHLSARCVGRWLPVTIFLKALQTTDDDFIDISESAIPGTNTYTIEGNGQSLSDWLFAVYVHSPTIAYFDALQARVDKEKKWVGALTSFSTYSLPTADWDTLG